MIIDSEQPYQETYQMKMLKNNQIPGLLKVNGCGREGAGRYYYHTEDAQTLEKSYKNRDLKAEEMMKLTRQFLSVAERMREYLLDPDGLILSEEYVFEKNGTFYFCFFPEKEKSWQLSYHELTEYFVRKVDYKDTESVLLACMLHKETLREKYDLKSIVRQYEEEAEKRKYQKQQEERIRQEDRLIQECGGIREGRILQERGGIRKDRLIQERGGTRKDRMIQERDGIQRYRTKDYGQQEYGQYQEADMQDMETEDGHDFSETMIFHLDQKESHYNRQRENLAVMEEKRYGPVEEDSEKIENRKMGEWDDLITEAEDYD